MNELLEQGNNDTVLQYAKKKAEENARKAAEKAAC